jgi:carbamoyltransferase
MERIVLGVYDGPSGGAALVQEGRLLAIAEEDRIVRRHRVSGLPRASVQAVLGETGVPGETVSAVVIATRDATYAEGVGDSARAPLLYRMGTAVPSPAAVSRRIRDTFARARRRRLDEALRSEFGISCPITFLDHHLVHAVAAAALTGRRDCLTLTMDGGSDGVWCQVASVRGGQPQRVACEEGSASLLGFLNVVCDQLGLAAGPDRYRRLEDLGMRGAPIHVERLSPYVDGGEGRLVLLDALFRKSGVLPGLVAGARKEDLAASALRFAGDVVRRYAVHWYRRGGHSELVLGGDLFDLPAMVSAVRAASEIERVLVPPAPGDAGLPAGCAYAGCLEGVLDDPSPYPDAPMSTPFVGTAYGDSEIEQTLLFESVEYRHHPDVDRDVARVLAEGRSVARFDGRTEIGDRGLGNRSVLRSPRGGLRRGHLGFLLVPSVYHAIVPEDDFAEWFEGDGLAPSRLRTAPGLVRPLERFVEECPDLVGWEGLVRVQTVCAEATPRLHDIIREFESWSGIPILAAAPFRLPDEPMVSSPRDALRTFRLLGADYAALGHYLVRNPDLRPSSHERTGAADEVRHPRG